jgi:hypothetical protein
MPHHAGVCERWFTRHHRVLRTSFWWHPRGTHHICKLLLFLAHLVVS